MDWKKLLKNLGLWEQFSYARSSKRKVCSGFGFGVGASLLLLTVFFLNYPFKEPLLYPTFEGFNGIGGESSLASSPLSFSSTDASSSLNFQRNEEERVQEETREGNHSERTKSASFNGGGLVTEKTHQGNLSEKGKNNSFLGSNAGELVTEKTHEGNPTERTESASSNGGGLVSEKTQQEILSEKGKNDTFLGSNGGELITEKTYEENPRERTESASSNGGGLVTEKTHQLNLSEKGKNCSFLGSNGGQLITERTREGNHTERTESASSNGGGLVTEKTRKGNFSEDKNGSFVVGEKTHQGNFSVEINKVKTLEAELVERYRNGSFLGKLRGFTDWSTNRNNMANVSDFGESVRSFGREESISEINHKDKSANSSNSGFVKRLGNYSAKKCDIFNGRWVRDEGKPYYPAGSCPYISKEFDCHRNGRPDNDYEKWRWQPNECDIPSLNATDFLERLRGKRLVFVGDSLSRNMWQSLVCILRHSVANKKKVYEITGKKEFKKSGFYSFRYEDYNCSIDLVTAPFLVRKSSFNGRNGSVETLRLDLMDRTTSMYGDADIIVFNSGHWWTHEKTSKGENYYQEGNYVYPKLKVLEAFKKAITTWARWVDKNINVNRTQVFFRGYSLVHFSGGQWNSGGKCHKETEPIFNETYVGKYPTKMRVLEHMLQQMSTPVVYMNVSKLTDYRKDAHPSIYRQRYDTVEEQIAAVRIQDCSHWCLPGVPDTWNELLYASLLMSGRGSWRT